MEKGAVSEEGDHVPWERQAENAERQLQKVGRVALPCPRVCMVSAAADRDLTKTRENLHPGSEGLSAPQRKS